MTDQAAGRGDDGRAESPIVFYFDFVSPFAYVGSVAIERVAAELGREVVWKPVLIGITILKIMGMKPLPATPLKGPYLARDLQRLAAWFDVPVRPHGLTGVNSVLACRAYQHLADVDDGLAKRYAQAAFRRLWVERRDITSAEEVTSLVRSVGGDDAAVAAGLDSDAWRQRLRAAVDEAVALGVFGVPTFIADGEMFWGNDHLWMMEHWLRTHSFARTP